MAKSYQRSLLVGLLMLAPLFAGCERIPDISGVTETVAPEMAAKPKKAKVVKPKSSNEAGKSVTEKVTPGKAEELKIGKYRLWIPKGAVPTPTTFRMTVLDAVIGVELEAFDQHGAPVRDFQVPLRLTLPYDEADDAEVADPTKLVIANIVSAHDHTILELVNPAVDFKGKTVTGHITHFSVWSLARQLAKELSPGID